MSYPKDLDEYTDEELLAELQRRQGEREQARCSYCKKPFITITACRLHERPVGRDNNRILVERVS